MTKVAYLGIEGTFSEQAARQHFGDDLTDVQASTFRAIFQALVNGDADYGILPIENSLAGTVAQSYELLAEFDALRVSGEIILHIEHALMSLPGVALTDIQFARSHPQALAQCDTFLRQHNIEPVRWYNTAGSAKDLAEDKKAHTAAIASARVADIYGLEIIADRIQDEHQNYTRFLVISQQEGEHSPNSKTSIMFHTAHQPGSLVQCLQVLARHNLNLTKIESRPTRDTPWQYYFLIDFEGHTEETNVQHALSDLEKHVAQLRILGAYPAATI